MRNRLNVFGIGTVLIMTGAAMAGGRAPIEIEVIVAQGDTPPGSNGATVDLVGSPFTDGNGKVGFVGRLAPGNNFVWHGDRIIWRNSDEQNGVLAGGESTMGVGNNGEFVYSPSWNGNDAAWSHLGLLLADGDPAPRLPGQFSTFNSRPTMTNNGWAHWVSGISTVQGGSTQGRVMYRWVPATGDITPLLKTGDTIDDVTISTPSGIDFDYNFSSDAQHYIQVLGITGPTATNQVVYLDGAIVLRKGSATGEGDNWAAFDLVDVNNNGNWIVTGDTDGDTATDEFVAYNGAIAVREGDTLDGITIPSGATLRAASINNLDRVAHMWGLGFGSSLQEFLFVGDGSALRDTSVLVLKTGDVVDIDGDGFADATVTDFYASGVVGPGLDFSDHDFIYLEVELLNFETIAGTSEPYDAIIKVPIPGSATPCPGDVAPKGGDGVVNVDDLLAVIGSWGPCAGCPADVDGNDVVNVDDLLAVIGSWGACE